MANNFKIIYKILSILEKGSRFEIKEVIKQGNKTVVRMEWIGNDG